jgi:predicted Zn-dependent protease
MEQNRVAAMPDPQRVTEAIAEYERVANAVGGAASDAENAARLTALVNQCDALIQMNTLPKALEVCRRVTELQPENPTAFYNLAGAQALSGLVTEALQSLEKDVALGDHDWQYLVADQWFESLRSHPRFAALVTRMKN